MKMSDTVYVLVRPQAETERLQVSCDFGADANQSGPVVCKNLEEAGFWAKAFAAMDGVERKAKAFSKLELAQLCRRVKANVLWYAVRDTDETRRLSPVPVMDDVWADVVAPLN